MNALNVFDPTLSGRLCLTLLHSLWQVALLALVAWAIDRFWRNRSVERSYALHVAALVLSLIALPLTYTMVRLQASPLQRAGTQAQNSTTEFTPPPTTLAPITSNTQPSTPTPEGFPAPTLPLTPHLPQVAPTPTWLRFAPWLAALYALGVAAMLLRLAAGMIRAERLRSKATPIVVGPLIDTLQDLAKSWSLRVVPALAQAEQVIVPKVVGLLKPTILLPASALAGLSTGELEMILAHELAHIRRHDMWINLLQRLAEVVLFFNPALWYLSRHIGTLRAYCCDELTCREMSATDNELRVYYAQALLHVVELAKPSSGNQNNVAALAGSGRSPSELRRRVARLFGEPLREPVRISRAGALAIATLAVLLVVAPVSWRHSTDAKAKDQSAEEDSSDSSRPALDDLLKRLVEIERAYLPYEIKSMHTFRMGEGLTRQQRDGFPWADGRKHQKLMEYAQQESESWMCKETLLEDGQSVQQFDEYFDGERLVKVTQLLSIVSPPNVREEYSPELIPNRLFAEPLYGVFPLSMYFSNDSLLTEAIREGKTQVALTWDGNDARLTFDFGAESLRSRFVIWLSANHDWHPYKLQRFDLRYDRLFSEWEVTRFVQSKSQWRIKEGTHRYRAQHELTIPAEKMTYALDFSILESNYLEDVPEKVYRYEPDLQNTHFIGNRFIICPVTTDLQRSLLGGNTPSDKGAATCVFVNVQSFDSLDDINRKAVGVDELVTELFEANLDGKREVFFRMIGFVNGPKTEGRLREWMAAIEKLVHGLGEKTSFTRVRVAQTFQPNSTWEEMVERARQVRVGAKFDETRINSDTIRVTPVATFLSRMLVNANYVAEFFPIVRDKHGARFRENVLPAVAEAVEKLDAEKSGNLLIRIRYTENAKQEIEDWINDIPGRKAYANELGFELCNVSSSEIVESDESDSEKSIAENKIDNLERLTYLRELVANHQEPYDIVLAKQKVAAPGGEAKNVALTHFQLLMAKVELAQSSGDYDAAVGQYEKAVNAADEYVEAYQAEFDVGHVILEKLIQAKNIRLEAKLALSEAEEEQRRTASQPSEATPGTPDDTDRTEKVPDRNAAITVNLSGRILLVASLDAEANAGRQYPYGMISVQPNTEAWTKLFDLPNGVGPPTISHDGQRTFFMYYDGQRRGALMLDTDGQTEPKHISDHFGTISCGPDGKKVIVSRRDMASLRKRLEEQNRQRKKGGDRITLSPNQPQPGHWLIDLEVGSETEIDIPTEYQIEDWSPVGNWLVAIRWLDEKQFFGDLYLMRSDGTDRRKLTNHGGGCNQPQFSSDGKYVAYCRSSKDEEKGIHRASVHTIDLATLAEREVIGFDNTFDGQRLGPPYTWYYYPAWSPNGNWLAVAFERRMKSSDYKDRERGVLLISNDGSQQEELKLQAGAYLGYGVQRPYWK